MRFVIPVFALGLLFGCSDPPEGVFGCAIDGDCPDGYFCRMGDASSTALLCYSTPSASDAGRSDAGPDTDGGTDGGIDGGSDAGMDAGPCGATGLFCDGACVEPMVDSMHCGGCGIVCASDRSCVAGACVFGSDGSDGAFTPTADVVLPTGVYNDTRITVPAGVTVTASGAGVLDLRATTDVRIEGRIVLVGGRGGDGVSFPANGRGAGSGGATGTGVVGANGDGTCGLGGSGGEGGEGDDPMTSEDPDCVSAMGGMNGGGGGGGWGASAGGGGGFAGGGGGGGYVSLGGRGAASAGGVGGVGGTRNVDCGAGASMSCGAGAGGAGAAPYGGGAGAHSMICAGGAPTTDFGAGGGGGGAIGADAEADLPVIGTFRTGSAGGAGGGESWNGGGSGGGGGGGGGGGALRLSSPTSITVLATGLLGVDGGSGGGSITGGGGGGGGSGGVIYLQAPTLDVNGTVSARGGVGGDSAGCMCDGGGGGIGRIRISATQATCTLGGTFDPPLVDGCVATLSPSAGMTYVGAWPN